METRVKMTCGRLFGSQLFGSFGLDKTIRFLKEKILRWGDLVEQVSCGSLLNIIGSAILCLHGVRIPTVAWVCSRIEVVIRKGVVVVPWDISVRLSILSAYVNYYLAICGISNLGRF